MPGKSFFILKMHHVMTDGYGVASFMANVSDKWDAELLPHLPQFNFWQKCLMYLTMPYHLVSLAVQYLFYPADQNPMTLKNKENTGVKRGFFAKEYSVDAVKRKSKEHNVTINDLLMTVISMTMKQYFISQGDEKTNRILMFTPFSLREKPAAVDNFEFSNHFAIMPVKLRLVNDFKTGVQAISRDLRPLRTSFVTFCMYYIVRLGQSFPAAGFQWWFSTLANKCSLIATNVRGPNIPFTVAGTESIKSSTFMPALGDVPGGFAIVSQMDVLWVSFCADRNRCDDAKQIIGIFEKTLDGILAGK